MMSVAAQSGAIATRTMRIWRGEDGIIRAVSLAGAHNALVDAVENIQACAKAGGEKRRPVLVDLRPLGSADGAARGHYAGPETARVFTAVVLLIGSPVSRMVGNFFLTVDRPLVPLRLFTDEAEALAWLRAFLPEQGGAR
ncbi:MAG: hypothetical protein HYS27_15800 [Deltaproteobacteria bacterium]|nr:hypothetical protein [Deltaproteobacteria bacterium]